MTRTRMTISLEQYGETVTFAYEDVTEFTVHELFRAFEKVARTLGYSDSVIMAGGCELAFNDFRDPTEMAKVAETYDLNLNEN